MPTQTLSITAAGNNGSQEAAAWNSDFIELNAGGQPGFSFIPTAQIPAGSTITEAYLRTFCEFDDTGGLTANIQVENADPTTNTAWSGSHLPGSATFFTANSTGSVNYAAATWFLGLGDTGATNFASQIQSLLNTHGTIAATNERINLRMLHTAGDGGAAQFEAFGAAGTNQAQLFINWTVAAGGGTIVVDHAQAVFAGQGITLRVATSLFNAQAAFEGSSVNLLASTPVTIPVVSASAVFEGQQIPFIQSVLGDSAYAIWEGQEVSFILRQVGTAAQAIGQGSVINLVGGTNVTLPVQHADAVFATSNINLLVSGVADIIENIAQTLVKKNPRYVSFILTDITKFLD